MSVGDVIAVAAVSLGCVVLCVRADNTLSGVIALFAWYVLTNMICN